MTQPIRTIRIATQGPAGPAGLYPHASWEAGSVPYVRSTVLAHNGGVWLALRDTSVEPSVSVPDDWASWIDFDGMISGVASLDENGKLLLSQLPAVAITDAFQVASQAAMLALSAHKGDIAIRSDLSKTFVLGGDDASVLANWKELLSAGAVLSVAGRSGAVTLSAGDVAGLSASATSDTTNAGNIVSGTLSNARLSGVAFTANNLSDLANAATARSNLGLGTIATQSASAVAITGGTISGIGTPSASADVANKAYVDALATLVSGALVFKGAWDASAGTFPGGGTAQTGYFYKVSVAGTVNGVAFDVGDDIYAVTNNASTSTYANNWLRIDGVVSGSEVTAALGYAPLSPGNNLSDVGNVTTARSNLGLAASATTDTTNASNISSGTLSNSRLSGVALTASANTFTTNGAASTPPIALSGTWYSGGSATTTKPQLLVEPSGAATTNWTTAGTGLGVNAASGFTGRTADFQVNGVRAAAIGYGTQTAGSPSIMNVEIGAHGSGIYENNAYAGSITISAGADVMAFAPGEVLLPHNVAIGWSSGTNAITSVSFRTSISEVSAGILQVGTTANNASGSLNLTNLAASGTVKTISTTVSGLPSASTSGSGARAFVTDATATTFLSTVTGGGSNKVPVVSDGTNWLIG